MRGRLGLKVASRVGDFYGAVRAHRSVFDAARAQHRRGQRNLQLRAMQIRSAQEATNSLLTARGVPTAGEGDLKTNIAMLLLDRLGAGGSYTEFYGLDFDEQFILMGHDGPGHLAIADGRPVARALKLYHGKAGAGLSIEMKVRLGQVTILGMTQTADGRLALVAAEGESVTGWRGKRRVQRESVRWWWRRRPWRWWTGIRQRQQTMGYWRQFTGI